MPEQLERTKELADRVETLKEKGMVSFDVEMTSEERESIQGLHIEKAPTDFEYYGRAGEELVQKLRTHLDQLEGNTEEVIETVSRLLARVTEKMQKDSGGEAVWMTVRITLPGLAYDIPRWHQDGHRMKSDDGEDLPEVYKLVFVPKGMPTRFAEIVDVELYTQCQEEMNENFDLHYESNRETYTANDLAIRRKLIAAVREIEPITNDQAALFRMGRKDAKVHSEGQRTTARVFMSVVAGSVRQIEALKLELESNE